jgi:hypothetical protein
MRSVPALRRESIVRCVTMRLVADFPQRWLELEVRRSHVGFVVDTAALGQDFLLSTSVSFANHFTNCSTIIITIIYRSGLVQ